MNTNFISSTEGKISASAMARQAFSERSVFQVSDATELLSPAKRKKILTDIRTLSAAPEEHYIALYQTLIENFAQMTQVLPINNEARLFSLLDEGLLRGLYVLQLQQTQNNQNKPEPLINYILFSAALMFDIGYTTANRMVIISNKDGDFVREWSPFQGALQPEDGYYKIRRGGGMPAWLCRRTTPLLARQLAPGIGFNWITQDSYAFNTWLALLSDDKEGSGALGLIFNRAKEMLEEFKTTQDFYNFVDITDINATEPKENELGEKFIEWLKQGIEAGSITINKPDSNVQVFAEGTVMRIESLLKSFISGSAATINMDRLCEQLERLGVTSGAMEVRYKNIKQRADAFISPFAPNQKNTAAASSLFGSHTKQPITEQQATTAGQSLFDSKTTSAKSASAPGILLSDTATRIVLNVQVAPNNNAELQVVNVEDKNKLNRGLPPINLSPPNEHFNFTRDKP
ncbi:MAG: hypothetical protein A2X78_00940 [Gammaproteobacteria bacterium GWE2_37_16]|nr:MAG: hypothetical protein A2X78_00940 [Gammaproteobacteria bacterium GWE2_37_16]